MSHSHIRKPKPEPSQQPWLAVAIGATLIVFLAIAVLIKTYDWQTDADHLTATGKVLETRIVVDHTRESNYGGRIFYRIDARVQYEIQGGQQERWIAASEATTERELLSIKLAPSPKNCLVHWPPKHPENARCLLPDVKP
ncbi:MAG: hypothetical protein WB424_19275 [Terracidiphilus sp.]